MSTINDNLDYGSILLPEEEKVSPKNRRKKARDQDTQSSRLQENKKSRENLLETQDSRNQEKKKARIIIDSSGRTRRPANITLQDDVKEALDILAVKRRVRPWTLLDQALREFLTKEGISLETK